MKKYHYNRCFIPNCFVEKQININNLGDRRGLSLMVIGALFLLPISIDKLINKNDLPNDDVKVIDENIGIGKKEIISWYDIMENNTDGVINKYGCNLNVYDIDVLNKICDKEEFSINTIENLGENKYKLNIIKEN